MKILPLVCYSFCLCAGLFLAYFELHTDDTGVEVFLIFLLTFLLGAIHPARAWQWALLIGPWAPAADIFQALLGKRPGIPMSGSLLGVAVAVVVVGLAGSYLGVALRKGITATIGHAV